MEITIFAKKVQTKGGKTFDRFTTRLTKKDGTVVGAVVKTCKGAKAFDGNDCPMNIEIPTGAGSMSKEQYMNRDGIMCDSYTLWVREWSKGSEYVDTSLDEFDI